MAKQAKTKAPESDQLSGAPVGAGKANHSTQYTPPEVCTSDPRLRTAFHFIHYASTARRANYWRSKSTARGFEERALSILRELAQ